VGEWANLRLLEQALLAHGVTRDARKAQAIALERIDDFLRDLPPIGPLRISTRSMHPMKETP
jgi:hypothetical protein